MDSQQLFDRIDSACMAHDLIPDHDFYMKKSIFVKAIRSDLPEFTYRTCDHAQRAVEHGGMSADTVWTLFVLTFGVEK